nr:relA-associated inhibitor-like [Vulpes vulpes]
MCLDSDPVICPVNRALLGMVTWKSHWRQELHPGLSIWPPAGYSHLHPQMMRHLSPRGVTSSALPTSPHPISLKDDPSLLRRVPGALKVPPLPGPLHRPRAPGRESSARTSPPQLPSHAGGLLRRLHRGGGRRGGALPGGGTGSRVRAHQAAPAPPSPDPAPEGVGRLGPQEPRPRWPRPRQLPEPRRRRARACFPASLIHCSPLRAQLAPLHLAWSLLAGPKLASPARLQRAPEPDCGCSPRRFPRFLLRARALAEELTLVGSSGNGDGDPGLIGPKGKRNREQEDVLKSLLPSSL